MTSKRFLDSFVLRHTTNSFWCQLSAQYLEIICFRFVRAVQNQSPAAIHITYCSHSFCPLVSTNIRVCSEFCKFSAVNLSSRQTLIILLFLPDKVIRVADEKIDFLWNRWICTKCKKNYFLSVSQVPVVYIPLESNFQTILPQDSIVSRLKLLCYCVSYRLPCLNQEQKVR